MTNWKWEVREGKELRINFWLGHTDTFNETVNTRREEIWVVQRAGKGRKLAQS